MEFYNILLSITDRYLITNDYRLEEIFNKIDNKLWEKTHHNPKLFLKYIDKSQIINYNNSNDIEYAENIYNSIKIIEKKAKKKIAYFSPEFGLHESLANYAGGLGVLAGDIIKTANAKDMEVFGVGLMYKKGYFEQKISPKNEQIHKYITIEYNNYPIEKLKDNLGNEITIQLELNNITIHIDAYKLKINSTFIILLNADLAENNNLRKITDNLYTGSRELRLLQEIILGIAGVRALHFANISYDILHINEGHAAFSLLERAKIYAEKHNLDFHSSIEKLSKTNAFTTHTPVIHGNEEFDIKLIRKYLKNYIVEVGIDFNEFLDLGKSDNITENKFSMTCLAINLSDKLNAVSKLHSITANKMWQDLLSKDRKKIVPVTNGIHIESWLASEFRELLNIDLSNNYSNSLRSLSNNQIIDTKKIVKQNSVNRLIEIMEKRADKKRYLDFKTAFDIEEDYLLISFARRFAKYKRADLVFSNINRLTALFKNKNIKIRMIFSGKAHPKDSDGKEILNNLLNLIDKHNLNEYCHFIPNYDIEIGRLLVQSSDIWLNTPVKPLEACGTSGMKNALNFGINLSICDGWWAEAYNGKNGFAIEDNEDSNIVSTNIIEIIENNILSLYLNTNELDARVDIMKNAFITAYEDFSSERMLQDYYKLFFD